MDRQYTIAVPLIENAHTNYLVLEYKGEEHQRFYYLILHLFRTMGIEQYYIYQGKDEEKVQVFIEVEHLTLEEAEVQLETISENLKQKLSKKWKCLPQRSLPEAYNIVTLPYTRLS